MSSPEWVEPGALDDTEAQELVERLVARGVRLMVRTGALVTTTDPALLTDDDRAELAFRKTSVLLHVLAGDDRVIERLGLVGRRRVGDGCEWPTCCQTCGDALPPGRIRARCGWCATAARLRYRVPLRSGLLDMFDASIAGPGTAAGEPMLDLDFPTLA